MNLPRIIYAALVGSLGLLVLLLSAWGRDLTDRISEADRRLNTMEAHYAAIEVSLHTLQEDIREVKQILRKPSSK